MKKEEHTEIDEDTMGEVKEKGEKAGGGEAPPGVLTQPGTKAQPIYTNNFVALRVTSAADFTSRSAEVMRLWNKANRDADGETKLVFAAEETKVGERAARQYTLDFATMLGGPAVP